MAGAGVSVVAGQQQFRPVACTVCLDSPLKVPIFQCLNGHLLCFECEDRLDDCPTCKVTLKKNPNKKIRSLAVEEIQEQLFYCANFSDGCTHVFLDTESRIVHESTCEVRANPLLENHPQVSAHDSTDSDSNVSEAESNAAQIIPRRLRVAVDSLATNFIATGRSLSMRFVRQEISASAGTSGAAATGSSSGTGASLNRRSPLASTSTSAVRASSTPAVVDLPSSDDSDSEIDPVELENIHNLWDVGENEEDLENETANDQNLTDLNWTEFTVNDSDDEGTAASGEDLNNADEGEDDVDLETTEFQGDLEADGTFDIELNSDHDQNTDEEDGDFQEDSDRSESLMNEDAGTDPGSDAEDVFDVDDASDLELHGNSAMSQNDDSSDEGQRDFDDEDDRSVSPELMFGPEVDGHGDSVMAYHSDSEGQESYDDDDERSVSPEVDGQGDSVMINQSDSEGQEYLGDDDDESIPPGVYGPGDFGMAQNTDSEDQDGSEDDGSVPGNVNPGDTIMVHGSDSEDEDDYVEEDENGSMSTERDDNANMANTEESGSEDESDSEDGVEEETVEVLEGSVSGGDEDANEQEDYHDDSEDEGDDYYDQSYQPSGSSDEDDDY